MSMDVLAYLAVGSIMIITLAVLFIGFLVGVLYCNYKDVKKDEFERQAVMAVVKGFIECQGKDSIYCPYRGEFVNDDGSIKEYDKSK